MNHWFKSLLILIIILIFSRFCDILCLQFVTSRNEDFRLWEVNMNYKQKLDKQKVGLNLYRLLDESNYTYEYVAEFLMLNSPRVIYDWTKGTKTPTVENLMNLAFLFQVRIEDILL